MLEEWIAQLRARDYERFLSIQLAPAEKRIGLYALSMLNLELARVAEIVSEPLLGHIRLAWWREAIEESRDGKKPRDLPLAQMLAEMLREQPAIGEPLLRMVEARAVELDPSLLAGESAWLGYCDDTAGALHHAWALWLDATAALAYADAIRDLSRAYAFIGLLRAIPAGHWRFPAPWRAQYDLVDNAPTEALTRFCEAIVNRAMLASPGADWPKRLAPLAGIEAAVRCNARWLRQAKHNPYAMGTKKLAFVSKIIKMNIKYHGCF